MSNPALVSLKSFSKVTKGTAQQIENMRSKAIFAEGEIPAKFKILSAMLWSISTRCEPCIKYYVSKAVDQGVTESELGEVLAVANTMGGCVGEMWALKAYQTFADIKAGKPDISDKPSCC